MKKVLTVGVFDYFHLGHLRLFKQCKNLGDYLIVAVQENDYILQFKPTASVFYSTAQRVEIIEALKIVDKVVTYKTISPEFLKTIDFDVFAIGEDQVGERWDACASWCLHNKKEVAYTKRTQGISSREIKAIITTDNR